MMTPIVQEANRISIMTGDGLSQLLTPFGVSRMLWRMSRKNHPEVTLAMTQQWVQNAEIMGAVMPFLNLLGVTDDGAKKNKTKHPTTARRRVNRSTASRSRRR